MSTKNDSNTAYRSLQLACDALDDTEREQILQVLRLHGIAGEYIEYSGNIAHIPLVDRVEILQLQGVELFSDSPSRQLLFNHQRLQQHYRELIEEPWVSPLPPVAVLSLGGRTTVCVRLPADELQQRWQWRIQSETGQVFAQDFLPVDLEESAHCAVGDRLYSARELSLTPLLTGALFPGYHQLTLRAREGVRAGTEVTIPLAVAPSRCFEPTWVVEGRRLWGFSVQLYSLRSARNWGIGDFADLQELIALAAAQGAGFLVLNPLHALDLNHPEQCSPYSPNDRRRLNILYLDPTREVDFQDSPALQVREASPDWTQQLVLLQAGEFIDYASVARFKIDVLAEMFHDFLLNHLASGSERAAAYARFVHEQGESLQSFAQFEAARHHPPGSNPVLRDPRFTLYTQWLAEKQLESCQQLARQLGMPVGLVRDLAVGGDGGGAEVALNNGLFCQRASIGAPPDPLAPQGQNWGLPPLDPLRLQQSGYRHFIELLRSNMAHCGALRIDHVMALMRLWWCPRYAGGGVGAYVHYPVDDLFALLRLESSRTQCLVIGEDLGVVPPEVRTYLNTSAVFSNVLFYFEKYDGYHFRRPEHYNPRALAMVANHDVPTLAAWWNCSDLELRHQLGLLAGSEDLEQQKGWRHSERQQVLRWLAEQWLLPESWQGDSASRPFDVVLCAAILRCSARSSSQLVSLQLDDLALLETPVNIPGTSTEYPNWRRRLPVDLQSLIASEAGRQLLAGFASERGS